MKVAELIRRLQACEQTADVVFHNKITWDNPTRGTRKPIAVTAGDEVCAMFEGDDDHGEFVALLP